MQALAPTAATAATAASADDDAATFAGLEELRAIEAALRGGAAGAALQAAGRLLAAGTLPTALLGSLCALTAEAAQALGLAEMVETMWLQAAGRAATPRAEADACANLAAWLARQGRGAEAEEAAQRALQADPDHVVALANLAVLLADAGRVAEAEACHRRVLELDPGNATTHSNLGVLLAASKRPEPAEHHYRRAIALAPGHAAAHANLGLLLQDTLRPAEAEAALRRALALAPESSEVHANLGNLLAALDRDAEAEPLLRRAIELAPESAAAHNNLGVFLAEQRRDAEAETLLRRALALRPGYPLARLDLSCLLLAQGRYAQAWPLHEARHDPGLPDNGISPPPLALPEWQGEPLAGRRLLVWPEQGLGDQIQFARCVPALAARHAGIRITLVCQRPLAALFRSLPGADAVIAADIVDNRFVVAPEVLGAHDCWTFPLSVPARIGLDLADLPLAPLPYLRADPARVAAWRARLDAADGAAADVEALRVGLVWRGNPRHHNDAERSLPGLSTLAPLWRVPGVRFVSLQPGRAGLAARRPGPDQPLLHLGGALADFADTAALLAQLDLLVCVDTSIAHLAGALGRPCWVLLPWHRVDWRWLRDRSDTPWYPAAMRLFRQPARGAWDAVVLAVADALAERARAPGRVAHDAAAPPALAGGGP